VNTHKLIAVDLDVGGSRVVIGRFNGGWLLDDVDRFLAEES
jgi:hypothetical protein